MADRPLGNISFEKGKRASASGLNAMLAAIRALSGGGGNLGGGFLQLHSIYNNTGATLDPHNVVGVGAFRTSADDTTGLYTQVDLTGDTPDEDTHKGRFAIVLEPIKAGEIGQAMFAGTTICKVNMVASAHKFADVKDGDATQLQSGVVGTAQILAVESSGTGTKWAVVRFACGEAETDTNPVDLGSTGETEAADTATWDRDAQGTGRGVDVIMLMRLAYDDAGDETLYGYYRTFTFDSFGKLKIISAETRVTIDVPEVCP